MGDKSDDLEGHGLFGELGPMHLIFGLRVRIHFAAPVDRLKWARKHYTNAVLPERRLQNECCSEKQVLLHAY